MKKKNIILTVIALFVCGNLLSQTDKTYKKHNIYIDALNLAVYYEKGLSAEFNRIIEQYDTTALKENPFLKEYLDPANSETGKKLQSLTTKQQQNGNILKDLNCKSASILNNISITNDTIKCINLQLNCLSNQIQNIETKLGNDSAEISEKKVLLNEQSNKLSEYMALHSKLEFELKNIKTEQEQIETEIQKLTEENRKARQSVRKVQSRNAGMLVDSNKESNKEPINYSQVQETPPVSSSWQAAAINGMANFMAGRFKQEVVQMAIDQIFDNITTNSRYKQVEFVFPKTYTMVNDLKGSANSTYYSADLELLRQTVQIDIENLPLNIGKNSDTLFSAMPDETKDMIKIASNIVNFSQNGYSINHLFTALANFERYKSDTIKEILQIADLFSQALMDTTGWVNPLDKLPINQNMNLVSMYFYGLLYQQLIQNKKFKVCLQKDNMDDFKKPFQILQKLCIFAVKLNDLNDFARYKNHQLRTKEDFITYIKTVNQTFCYLVNILNENKIHFISDSLLEKTTTYLSIIEYTMQGNYQKAISNLLIDILNNGRNPENLKLIRTLSFLSQLATVQNSKEMENLIQAHALPMGSSAIKRKSSFNMSVNGYVGITGGWDYFDGAKCKERFNYGLSAPVGLSLTWSCGFTLFGSIIDIGSLVNQRLINNYNDYANLRLEHFFTPGLGLFWNVPKYPITMGLHCSYVPNFKTIKYNEGIGEDAKIEYRGRDVLRINFSLLIDIPFFTIYNKPK